MLLAEALINRADLQKRIAQLQARLTRNVKVQEGDQPAENPAELLAELDRNIVALTGLIQRINLTNVATELADGQSLTAALAQRDTLAIRRRVLTAVVDAASVNHHVFSRSEIRFVSTVDVADLQRQADDLARQFRELDAQIQAKNWQVELVEG